MLEDLNSFTALIQFMGAFNLANVYCKYHDIFSKNFFNIEEEFNRKFKDIGNQIITDRESVNNMKIIETTEFGTNEDCINELKKDYKALNKRHKEEIKSFDSIYERHKPCFMQSMFLIIGIYSVLILFVIALLNVYEGNSNIKLALATFNMVTCIYSLYLFICEAFLFFNIFQIRLFRPTLISSLFIYPVLLVIFGLLLKLFFETDVTNCNFLCFISWAPVYLPFSSFLLCIVFVLLYITHKLKPCVEEISNRMVSDYNALHKRKKNIDDFYGTFKKNIKFTSEKDDVENLESKKSSRPQRK
jgi:hypothetical protein